MSYRVLFQGRSPLGEVNQATGFYKIREKGLNLPHFAIKINGSQCAVHVYTQPDQNMLNWASFDYEKCLKKWSYFWALEK